MPTRKPIGTVASSTVVIAAPSQTGCQPSSQRISAVRSDLPARARGLQDVARAAAVVGEDGLAAALPAFFELLLLLADPGLEPSGLHNHCGRPHERVAEAAQLGADDRE